MPYLSDSICCVQFDAASLENRLGVSKMLLKRLLASCGMTIISCGGPRGAEPEDGADVLGGILGLFMSRGD